MILRRDRAGSGFTLVEILLAVAIFATIMAIIYGLFSSIEGSVAKIEKNQERLRVTNFLLREISRNLASAYIYSDQGGMSSDMAFVGEDIEEGEFAADSLHFVSLAPPLGGAVAPGGPKAVSIKLEIPPEETLDEMGIGFGEEEPSYLNLREEQMLSFGLLTEEETELTGRETDELDELFDEPPTGIRWTEDEDGSGMGTEVVSSTSLFDTEPVWSIEARSFNLQFYDGADWVDSWDSSRLDGGQFGLLPWAVKVEIDYPLDEGEEYSYADMLREDEDEHDFVTIVTLPLGYGIWPEEAAEFAGRGGMLGMPLGAGMPHAGRPSPTRGLPALPQLPRPRGGGLSQGRKGGR